MGTNYYIYSKPCPTCGRADEIYHIGKSSGGWCFSLHVDPVNGINDLSDIKKLWKGKIIKDEYGDEISKQGMLKLITKRSCPRDDNDAPYGYRSWEDFHWRNNSCPGLNGLVRHRIEEGHCIGHGEGTWDLIVGEFS